MNAPDCGAWWAPVALLPIVAILAWGLLSRDRQIARLQRRLARGPRRPPSRDELDDLAGGLSLRSTPPPPPFAGCRTWGDVADTMQRGPEREP